MTSNFAKSLLSTPDCKHSVTRLTASLPSLQQAAAVLDSAIGHVQSVASDPVIGPALADVSNMVSPLRQALAGVESSFSSVATTIRDNSATVASQARLAKAWNRDLQQPGVLVASVNGNVTAIATLSRAASGTLSQYHDALNQASSRLDTLQDKLSADDVTYQNQVNSIRASLDHMSHENIFEKIADGFKAAFGDLQEKLQREARSLTIAETQIKVNTLVVATVQQMVVDLGTVASVASALEVSWGSLSDLLGTIGSDILASASALTEDAWQSDMDYVAADWEDIENSLNAALGSPAPATKQQ